MPLIPSNYINSWYKIQDKLPPNNFYILREINSNLTTAVNRKDYIQGDAGTHALTIGESVWKTTISSNILITKQLDKSSFDFLDVFDLFLQTFYKLRTYFADIALN